jgi:hypothetical protein
MFTGALLALVLISDDLVQLPIPHAVIKVYDLMVLAGCVVAAIRLVSLVMLGRKSR